MFGGGNGPGGGMGCLTKCALKNSNILYFVKKFIDITI